MCLLLINIGNKRMGTFCAGWSGVGLGVIFGRWWRRFVDDNDDMIIIMEHAC